MVITAALLDLLAASSGFAQALPLPEHLISLDSDAGATLLFASEARVDYLPLTRFFVTQDNLAYCGVATMVMVLNALNVEAPAAAEYPSFNFFTQHNVFDNARSRAVVSPEVVMRQGMTLDELGGLLSSYSLAVQVYHAEHSRLEEFRAMAIANLEQPNNYILVNYLRSSLGQERGGHISPLAAYDAESDRFLILDVSRYKYPPIWVTTTDLWNAMNTIDSTSNQTRGFVVVGAPNLATE